MSGLVWREEMRRRKLQLAAMVTRRCPECGDWVTVAGGNTDHGRLFMPRCRGKLTGRRRYRASAFYGGTWIRPETLPVDIRAQLQELLAQAKAEKVSQWRTLQPETED